MHIQTGAVNKHTYRLVVESYTNTCRGAPIQSQVEIRLAKDYDGDFARTERVPTRYKGARVVE